MPHYLNIDQLGRIDPNELDLRLRRFSGYEELSRLYQFELDIDLPVDRIPLLTAGRTIGQPIVFSVNGADAIPSFFSGIVSSLSFGNTLNDGRRTIHLQVVPELWKLTQMLNTKRFANLSVDDLAEQLISTFGADLQFDSRISRSQEDHPVRANPVQYDETPYNFMARLLVEESVYFYFLNEFSTRLGSISGRQRMVLGDSPNGYTELTSPFPGRIFEMRFHPTSSAQTMDMVTDWARQFHFRPGAWTIQDHDYEKSRDFNMMKSSHGSAKSAPHDYKKFKRAAGFKETDYGTNLLDRFADRELAESEFVRAESYCHFLHPGIRFRLADHEITAENGNYVVTSIEHHAVDDASNQQPVQVYENTFTCVPSDRLVVECPYGSHHSLAGTVRAPESFSNRISSPTRRTPGTENEPSMRSRRLASPPLEPSSRPLRIENRAAEIAFVCDRDGKYSDSSLHYGTVQTDSDDGHGRVLVRFPWENDDPYQANRWVRVAQPTAGKDWGGKFLPRVGDEVVVMYIDGTEQRPMIVGTVYNDVHSLSNHQPSKIHKLGHHELNPFASDGQGEVSIASSENEQISNAATARDEDFVATVPSLEDPNVSGFRTRTNICRDANSTADVGYNELLFDDTEDLQQIYIRAERDLNIHVKNDLNIEVCGNKNEIIRGDYFRVANVGASPNGYVTEAARRYPTNSDGGVARSISDGDNYDYDKVWQVWTVEAFQASGATNRLGSSHSTTHTDGIADPNNAPKYYLVKTETYADQHDLNVGDVNETFSGHFEEHFHGRKLEVVKGDPTDSEPTIRTEICGYTHETFDGKTDTRFTGEYVKTKFDGVDVEEYYLGSNVFSYHGGAKEEIMLGLAISMFLGGAIDVFVGNKLETFAGNLVSIHKGSKYEVAPDHKNVNAKWTSYVTSFGVTALAVKLNGLRISLN